VKAVILLGALAMGMTASAGAQEAKKVWRVGYMSPYSAEFVKPFLAGFVGGMKELGYIEGKNLVVEARHSQGNAERLQHFARELTDLKVDIFLAHGLPQVIEAARDAGGGKPIVFVPNPDPVGLGLVSSLGRPGGNITGLSDMHGALGAKRLELLKEVVPSASRFGILLDASRQVDRAELERLQKAAPALHVRLIPVHVSEPADIPQIFETLKRERVDAFHIIYGTAALHLPRVTEMARQHRLPNIVTTQRAADAGALLSYGADFPDLYRRAATYVHKIFNGARPGDLPIEQPTKFVLTVNLKAAKAMGVSIPPALLQRADHVIE
jgi:putative ABC transport system substrate-binding protein